jgi:dienelactone hydrolase
VTRSTLATVLTALVAFTLAGIGTAGLVRADDGLVRRAAVVDGLPTVILRAAGAQTPRAPGVVVAHGFAGSGALMTGFADTLARNGFVVELFDFAGHGANTRPLDTNTLGADLDIAVRHLRADPGVDPGRIGLVGHSMGAGAVVAYGATHPDIAATVAISLPDARDVPTGPGRPRDLLLMYGAAEFPQFPVAALTALQAADPSATLGRTIGDPAAGTARRAVAVPGVEHISILFADAAHRETLVWLATALGTGTGGGPVQPRRRLVPASLLLLGLVLGFYPLARLVLGRSTVDTSAGTGTEWGTVELGLGLGVVLAIVVGLLAPDDLFGLAVGGYAAAVFAAVGAGALGVWYALGRERRPVVRRVRRTVGGVVLTAYGAAAIAVPVNAGLTRALPAGPRWWLLPLVALAGFALFLGAESLGGRRWIPHAAVLAVTAVVLTGLGVTGAGPAFIVLVVPLLAILLVVEAGWAAVLRRLGAPAWIGAAAGAALAAWPVALTNPLV